MRRLALSSALVLSLALAPALVAQQAEAGFTSLFDGKTLAGWTLVGGHGEGYGVKDGVLFCAKGGGGKLLTDKEYSDFVLRFEFRMPPEGSNNGLGIRAPSEGDAAYQGMELQILDEKAALVGQVGQAEGRAVPRQRLRRDRRQERRDEAGRPVERAGSDREGQADHRRAERPDDSRRRPRHGQGSRGAEEAPRPARARAATSASSATTTTSSSATSASRN